MESLKERWKKFDTVNTAHEVYLKKVNKIQEKKEQKVTGKKPPEYLIPCYNCKKIVKIAFTAINPKKGDFICFDCLAVR